MTRTISLITATVGAALLFVVPAYGDNWGADQAQPAGSPGVSQLLMEKNGVVDQTIFGGGTSQPAIVSENTPQPAVAPDWFERAAIAAQNRQALVLPDSADLFAPVTTGYLDAAARAQRIDTVVPTVSTDAFERASRPVGSPTGSVEASGSGSEIDWSQLGIGFGIGLVLALGLLLAMRYTRVKPLAH